MAPEKILIIEDDTAIAEAERDFLEMNGFTAHIEYDGAKGLNAALSADYDLILLDLMLPGINGLDICRRIREKIDVPILMISARTEDSDKVRGLGLGADDYISKPFSLVELMARVRSHLARYKRFKNDSPFAGKKDIIMENVSIETATRRVFVNKKEIELANKEFELLYFLASNPLRVYDKETIYGKIWGEDVYGDLNTVTVHINRLREKIEHAKPGAGYIQTVRGAGYRFHPDGEQP
jgi:DNA-binding response OmpR family regulator